MGERDESMGYSARAEGLLSRIETAVDRLADDLDIDVLRAGNVITLTFDNDHRIIVNTQEAAGEIWIAARSGGFHYRWDVGTLHWLDTRSNEDMILALARLIGVETGTTPILGIDQA